MRLLRSHSIYKKCVDTYALKRGERSSIQYSIKFQILPPLKKEGWGGLINIPYE